MSNSIVNEELRIQSENSRGFLNERKDIMQLYETVKDDPEMFNAALVLIDILGEKKDFSIDRLSFIPEDLRMFFEVKIVNGIISFSDFKAACQEMINCPMKARAC